MPETTLTAQELADGQMFSKWLSQEGTSEALGRLVTKLKQDVWNQYISDESTSKKWLKGSMEMAENIIPAIESLAKRTLDEIEAEKQAKTVVRVAADDGFGSGDFA